VIYDFKIFIGNAISVAFSFFAHKIIAIPELYFIFGALDVACCLLIILGNL